LFPAKKSGYSIGDKLMFLLDFAVCGSCCWITFWWLLCAYRCHVGG